MGNRIEVKQILKELSYRGFLENKMVDDSAEVNFYEDMDLLAETIEGNITIILRNSEKGNEIKAACYGIIAHMAEMVLTEIEDLKLEVESSESMNSYSRQLLLERLSEASVHYRGIKEVMSESVIDMMDMNCM